MSHVRLDVRRVSAVLAVILAACNSGRSSVQQQGSAASTDTETAAARAEILAATTDLTRLLGNSAIDSAASRLTEDYHWLPPEAPQDSGRANWIRVVRGMIGTAKYSEQATMASLVVSGPFAVSRGRIIATVTPGPGAPKVAKASVDTSKYLWQWRRVDGHWLLATAAWNSDSPRR